MSRTIKGLMRHSAMVPFLRAASVLGVAMLAASAQASVMDSAQIKQKITGKRVYLSTPFGGEFPLHYRADGQVDGTGEALGLGKLMRPKDTGRWWVTGEKLCQQWQSWYDGRVICFTLTATGEYSLQWNQDNGDTGTARIGE